MAGFCTEPYTLAIGMKRTLVSLLALAAAHDDTECCYLTRRSWAPRLVDLSTHWKKANRDIS
jgi:hypothetical protein